MRRLLLAALVAVTFGPAAHAANQTVLGTSFVVKDPSTPDKRKITVTAKEKASDDSIVGNPVTGGAALTITVHGTTPHVETFPMPVGMSMLGKPFWSGDATKGFKYKDTAGENGPVKTAAIKKSKAGTFTMKALIDGKLGAISVLPPDLGTDACALLAIENGDLYSVAFTTGLVKNKTTQLFKVTKPTAEGTCGRCGDGIIDPGEECDAPGTPCGPGAVCSSDCTCPCDFLDPSKCMFPFPSDYLTVADATTPTGRRIHFADAGMPQNASNVPIAAADYNKNDGFSPGSSVLLHVPSVDLTQTGAAPVTDAARSLDAGAPIVIVNADTLVHHPFWAELDANATSEPNRALILRPLVNYAEGGHYIVALRDMKDGTGAVIPPGADFAAYRDNTPTGDPVKEARRAHMESLFTTLAAAGVPRANLYLAWDFTVSSRVNNTQRVLDMRDDAFARLGSAAPSFVVSNVNNSTGDPRIARIVTGTYQVDRYVDSTTPPAHLVLDANGHPVHQATPQPAPFQCIIPTAALPSPTDPAVPARGSIYGHGLLGSYTEVTSGNVRDMANEHNFVFCATDWIGMASGDVGNAVAILQNLAKFSSLADRLQQAMVDQLYLARLMINHNGFDSDPAFQDAFGGGVIDRSAVYYDGNSQGGIFGGTVMAISKDITRGVLGVTGMNYSLLLTRSTDFAAYSAILYPAYPNEMDRPLDLALIQMLWDRSDPAGYAAHIMNNPLPGTPAHKVLMHVAFGDHQVSTVSAETEARTIGASIHTPAINPGRNPDVTPYYAIPAVPTDPFSGSAMVVWDSGAVTPPTTNTAPTVGPDPHSDPRNSPVARRQKAAFLSAQGAFIDVCSGAPCTIP